MRTVVLMLTSHCLAKWGCQKLSDKDTAREAPLAVKPQADSLGSG